MGTPPERYDSEHASVLLKSQGDDIINTATRNLVNAGVLSKLQRDPKRSRPGRLLKISESFVILYASRAKFLIIGSKESKCHWRWHQP